MTRKSLTILVFSLLLFAFFAVNSFGTDRIPNHNVKRLGSVPKAKLAGAEHSVYQVDPNNGGQSLGADVRQGPSPGKVIGYTTYDYQSNCRMNRQVGWSGPGTDIEIVHMDWMKQMDSVEGGDRGTGYEAWDPDGANLIFVGIGGGCDIHPRLGSGVNYSGYVGLDVDTESKVNLSNHHDEGAGYASTIWYDYSPAACFFSPFRSRLPDSTMEYIFDEDDEFEYIWPNHDYHVFDGDTVTHLFSHQFEEGIEPSIIAYFRRVGSDTVGAWDYPPVVIDTVADIGQFVTSSPVSAKVALVWIGNIPEVQGHYESGLTGSQRENDLFIKLSDNMGADWTEDQNITANRTDSGWFLHGDLSALYGTDDYLHVIYDAREVIPVAGGTYTHFYGCRLFHYSNDPAQAADPIRVVADANWDLPQQNFCHGGAWNEMSIVKMSISECNGKFYAFYTQYNDIRNGIDNDCHQDAFTGGQPSTANGELYVNVSDNGGFNWDLQRNLTNTRTPGCDHEAATPYYCGADMWMSAARFGMQVVTGDFTGVDVIIPEGGTEGDYYIDVIYVNDEYPGGCVQDAGQWTYNPVKWFRVPCVDPVPAPVISLSPSDIGDPTWTKPDTPLDTTIRIENIGNFQMEVSSIVPTSISPAGVDWICVNTPTPFTVSQLTPNYENVSVTLNCGGVIGESKFDPVLAVGYLTIQSDATDPSVEYSIELIVADTVQFPVEKDIRTACKRIIWNNAGNIGDGGNYPDGGYNLNFFDDCDTTDNTGGANDNASVYLYDASPFVLRINDAGDTVLNYYMFDADWLSSDGLRPLGGPVVDSVTYPDYQYGYTGRFGTMDTAVCIEIEYFAPTDPDSCSFIIMKQRFYNCSDQDLAGVYVGELFDWDIPGDTAVRNGSGFDAPGGEASLDLMYCYGGEYDDDSIVNNDCVLADERLGGLAFYNGFKTPYCPEYGDSLENPNGPWWTHMNADWVYPTGGFVGSQLYQKMENMGTTWDTWEATADPSNPDSMFQDLNMVAVFGQFDLAPGDTLVFVKILTSTYEGLIGLQNNVLKARQWIENRPFIFSWPTEYQCSCCDVPGDANNNGSVNILDITFLIAYLYQGGPPPDCCPEGDANGNAAINILDITYLIAYLYQGGPPPICNPTYGNTACH
jgi:hypothetical protein